MDSTVIGAFLDAVNPAGVDATAAAVDQLEAEHAERRRMQTLALERAQFEAERRRRQFDACEPENRLVARTLEAAWEQTLAETERQRGMLCELDWQRPAPVTDAEGRALRRLAGEVDKVWRATTTSDRDRKQLLRALLDDVVLNIDRDKHVGTVELLWQGGARTVLPVRLKHSATKRTGARPEPIDLIRQLAEHSSDPEIAMVLSKPGWNSPTGLPFTAARLRVSANGREAPARRGCTTGTHRGRRPERRAASSGGLGKRENEKLRVRLAAVVELVLMGSQVSSRAV